jgi:uncharacterized Ntn-hydrolase superfamily protein
VIGEIGMLTGTFSIVAYSPGEQALGVAVATAIPGAGAICPFVNCHGAISTQSFNNYYFGIDGLAYLGEGLSATVVGDALLRGDEDRELRQLVIVDGTGESWAFTGSRCVGECGHRTGRGYAIAGNMLAGQAVLDAMVSSYEATARTDVSLAERLMQTLEAGQLAGGDKRGKQSAALKVLGKQGLVPICDLRVDENPNPVFELRRIYEVAKRELLPFMAAMPTRSQPRGSLSPALLSLLEKAPSARGAE